MHKPLYPSALPLPRGLALAWNWLVPLLLFVAGAAICFHDLQAQSLWLDEGYAASYVTGNYSGQLIADLWSPTAAYPLYHLLLKLTTRVLGDSEWALRLPSAVAGSLAVPMLYALGVELRGRLLGASAALLLLVAPFAIWQAQDAKAYSLTLLVTILLGWSCARALRTGSRRDWFVFALVAVVAPFVHRLLLLVLLGCIAAIVSQLSRRPRRVVGGIGVGGAAVAITLLIGLGLRQQGATSQFMAAGPLQALRLTATKFALDRWPGEVTMPWLVPFAGLFALGAGWWLFAAWRVGPKEGRSSRLLLLWAGVPLLILLALMALQPLYEPRYFILLFPAWLLVMANGVAGPLAALTVFRRSWSVGLQAGLAVAALIAVLLGSRTALYDPQKGLFGGATVKEDFRGAVQRLAEHVHPDDMVVVHPDSVLPLYSYYAKRVSNQPLPEPTIFSPDDRELGFQRYELDTRVRAALRTHKRAWLLIAPGHANVVDPPPHPENGDTLGWVGLAFQYGDQNGRIQCGEPPYAGFNGVQLFCNNMPDIGGVTPRPAFPLAVEFGDALRLRGITITPFAGGPRPGGTLPVTLFWEPLRSLEGTDYQIFVHLTRPDDPTPLAQIDGRPMEGGQPTSRWTKPGVVLHDDRTIALPAALAPGRYVLRIGVYYWEAAGLQRLPVRAPALPAADRSVVIAPIDVK